MASHLGTLQRRLETVLVELKRARNTWNELNTEGMQAANKLVNTVIQSRYADDKCYWHPCLIQEFPNVIQKYDHKMKQLIVQDCQKVKVTIERMVKQYNKMIMFVKELVAIEQRAKQVLENDQVPLFKTCPVRVYVKRVQDIVTMYKKELASKQLLVEEGFSHVNSQEEGLALLSAWLNQPHLDQHVLQEFDDLCVIELEL